MGILWRLAMAGFLHVLLLVGATEVFPPPFAGGITPEPSQQFLALLAVGGAQSLAIAMLVGMSRLRGISLLVVLAVLVAPIWIALPALSMVITGIPEAPAGTAAARMVIAGVQTAGWLPVTTWLMSQWWGPAQGDGSASLPPGLAIRVPLVLLTYLGLRVVAEQVAAVQAPEAAGFFGLASFDTAHWGMVALRGPLVALVSAPIVLTSRGGWFARGLVLGFALITFDAARWALPTSLLDDAHRWPMLALASGVSGLFGVVVAAALGIGADRGSGMGGTTVAQPAVMARRGS